MTVATPWVAVPDGSPFSVQALPYVVFSVADEAPRIGVGIGTQILDLAATTAALGLDGGHVFEAPSLAPFMALGPSAWAAVRSWVSQVLTHPADEELVAPHLLATSEVRLHAPFEVADLTCLTDDDHHSLVPPTGRHGRAGSIRLSGETILRPCGPRVREDPGAGEGPTYGPSRHLDVDAGIGFIVGTPSRPGEPVPATAFAEHVFGVVLIAQWSARDLLADQSSFATSMSPWVLPLAALEQARLPAHRPLPEGLDYLADPDGWRLDVVMDASVNGTFVARVATSGAQWTPAQLLAHLTVAGTPLRTGDIVLVRPTEGAVPSLLDDGDEVVVRGWAPAAGGGQIGLGELRVAVAAARTLG